MMLTLTPEELRAALGAGYRSLGGSVTGLCTDSRKVRSGDLFFALAGTRTSGERFVTEALDAGAVGAVVGPGVPSGRALVSAKDPLRVLGRVAALVRARFPGPVAAITGTVGKTSVKECLRSLLPGRLQPVLPEASFNNLLGVSLTLGRIEESTGVVVLELGTSTPGEIRSLCELGRPTLGVFTAIGPGHLEGLGSVAGVLEEKLDLARGLPQGAEVLANWDDANLRGATWPSGVSVTALGLEPAGGVLAPTDPDGHEWLVGPRQVAVSLPRLTRIGRLNLWIAMNVALRLGARAEELAATAGTVRPAPLRGEELSRSGATLILDCYNANPLSMEAALRDLAQRPGRRVAVLGEMLELGAASSGHHERLGALLAELDLDAVTFLGPSADRVRDSFVAAGGPPRTFQACATLGQTRRRFDELEEGGGFLLLKGSRGIGLERLLEPEHG